jgi:hypothetical protein
MFFKTELFRARIINRFIFYQLPTIRIFLRQFHCFLHAVEKHAVLLLAYLRSDEDEEVNGQCNCVKRKQLRTGQTTICVAVDDLMPVVGSTQELKIAFLTFQLQCIRDLSGLLTEKEKTKYEGWQKNM